MRFLSLALFTCLTLCQAAVARTNCVEVPRPVHASPPSTPRTITVVLYPFIPRFDAFKDAVKKGFEAKHSDIRIEILDLTDNYYGPFKPKYIGCADADVYEIDSVFLQDFVINKKIQPLPVEAAEPDKEYLKNAVAGGSADGKRYGAPHWVCGNFLFFDSSDKQMRELLTLSELMKVIGESPAPNRGLAVDLMGKSTLGEFYLNAAFDRYGDLGQALEHVVLYDSGIRDDLTAIAKICTSEGCRKSEYHDTPFFAEEFAEKHARAFVGYSEKLAGALGAMGDKSKCPSSSACLSDADFEVEALPLDDKGAHPMSWVDSFVVDARCKEQCAKDVAEFIRFVNSDEVFLAELLPQGAPPAYLLPAKASLYTNQSLLHSAHLYPKLRTIIEGAAAPSAPSLNDELRILGARLDSDLPR